MILALRMAWAAGRVPLLARVVLTVALGLLPAVMAWQLKVVLDRLSTQDSALLVPFVLLAVCTAALAVLPELSRYCDLELQRVTSLLARRRLYAAVGRLVGLRRFEDPQFHDRLSLAAEAGPAGPPAVVTGGLGMTHGILMLSGFLVTLMTLSPWMVAAVCLSALPALRAELLLGQRRARLMWEQGQTARREFFYSQLLTSVTAAKEVRLYGLSGLFGARMLTELRTIHSGQRQMDLRELLVQAAQSVLGAGVAGIGLWWALREAVGGRLTVGDVSLFVTALGGVQGGLITVLAGMRATQEAMLLFGHYRHVLEAEPDLPTGRAKVPALQHGIVLTDVWFRYGDDLPWVLRGVTMTIPARAATALVGVNGAGKSTLVKLLCRFYDPVRGTIAWDGVDLRDLDVDALRRRIGAVFQDFMAYELTVADNIGLGSIPGLEDREQIMDAARRAGCHEFIAALPRGYDTLLTRVYMDAADRLDPSTGVELSGGQWQRLALARALMRQDSELVILDEPQSGMDASAEHATSALLREHRQGRSSLLISHRLSAVRDADNVIVLADGRVAEQGTHASLVSDGGRYAHLFSLQASGYRD